MNTSDTVGMSVSVTCGIGWPEMPASAVVQESSTPAIWAYAASAPRSRPVQYAVPDPPSPAVTKTVSTQRPLAMSALRSGFWKRMESSSCATTYTLLPSEQGVAACTNAGDAKTNTHASAATRAAPAAETCRIQLVIGSAEQATTGRRDRRSRNLPPCGAPGVRDTGVPGA